MATKTNKYQSQIDSETELRYGPQLSALATLLSNAQSERNQALSVNTSTANALSNAARLAQPEVKGANADYLAQLMAAKGTLGQDTAAWAGSGDPFKEASARDMANAQVRAAETTKASSDELTQRGLDARSGAVAGARAINDRYAGQSDQIGQQAQELTGQSGTYAASRLAELLGVDAKTAHETAQARADRQSSQDIAGAQIQSREDISSADRASREKIAAEKADPKKVKWQTPQAAGKVSDTIAAAQAAAEKMKAAGRSRSEIAKLLVGGRPTQSVQDPNTGAITSVPGVSKVPELYASVALDVLFDKHVSARNVALLHKRRLKISDLGLPTRPPKSTSPTTTVSPGASSTGGLPIGPIGPVSIG